jgi:hypothetical protein
MKRKIRTRRVVRRRGQFHAVLWLVGLAVLAMTDSWWPGILILVVISILLESAVKRKDQSGSDMEEPETVTEEKPEVALRPVARGDGGSPAGTHRAEWLPLNCPKCGAPTAQRTSAGQVIPALPALLRVEPAAEEI